MDHHCVCGDCTWAREVIAHPDQHTPDQLSGASDTLRDHQWVLADRSEGDEEAIAYAAKYCKIVPGYDPAGCQIA